MLCLNEQQNKKQSKANKIEIQTMRHHICKHEEKEMKHLHLVSSKVVKKCFFLNNEIRLKNILCIEKYEVQRRYLLIEKAENLGLFEVDAERKMENKKIKSDYMLVTYPEIRNNYITNINIHLRNKCKKEYIKDVIERYKYLL